MSPTIHWPSQFGILTYYSVYTLYVAPVIQGILIFLLAVYAFEKYFVGATDKELSQKNHTFIMHQILSSRYKTVALLPLLVSVTVTTQFKETYNGKVIRHDIYVPGPLS
jgi:TRAP-type C4-dicarboxylate transport system permease large subunit